MRPQGLLPLTIHLSQLGVWLMQQQLLQPCLLTPLLVLLLLSCLCYLLALLCLSWRFSMPLSAGCCLT
jgi:hypothetical protein